MIDALPKLRETDTPLRITHQTGEADFEKVRQAYAEAGADGADVRPYITDMVAEFEKADLIISRAGATTCAEVAAAGKASLMVPLPSAADDHQRKNAEAMAKDGAVSIILQSDLSGDSLAERLIELLDDTDKLGEMGASARRLARPDAAAATVDLIEGLRKNR